MTSPTLIEDRLAEIEEEMGRIVEEHGFWLVAVERNLEVYEQDRPPTADDLREAIGRYSLENAPFRAMEGAVFWVYEEHRALSGEVTVQIVYPDGEHLFIQEELRGIVAVTRLDKLGRIRLLSKEDVERVTPFIRIVGYAA